MGKGPYATCQTWAVVSSNKTVDSTYGRRRDARMRAYVCNRFSEKPVRFFVRPAVVLIETGGKG